MTDTEAERRRHELQAEEDARTVEYDGNYAAHVNENGDGWAVWNDESGQQVLELPTLEDAIAVAHDLNTKDKEPRTGPPVVPWEIDAARRMQQLASEGDDA